MKIILNQPIYKLGDEGDICEVKNGYARNYLIPQGLAKAHTKHNLDVLVQQRKSIARNQEKRLLEAQTIAEKLRELHLVFEMTTSEGQNSKVFGAVSNTMVLTALEEKGLTIERRALMIPGHVLKTLGEHEVYVRLYGHDPQALKVTLKAKE